MASEFDTTGTITRTLKSSCVVSVSIDDVPKSFSVSKTIFYTYGLKCDGDLTNLVEDGTEVDVCYRLRPGGSPTIVAVWLGEKPPSEGQDSRTSVYEQKGVLSDISLDVLVVDSDIGKVLIKKDVTFRDGQREASVSLGEEITFDAIPLQGDDSAGALHQATCAWIGRKPTLVDRFHLLIDEIEDLECEDVSGTVVVIPNDVVAFAEVEVECVPTKVMVFRSSFRHGCDRIQDAVDVGDQLCMRLRYAFVFPGCKQWFALRAVKASDEVRLDELCGSDSVESEGLGNETEGSGETDNESYESDTRDKFEKLRTSESLEKGKNPVESTFDTKPVDAGKAASSAKRTDQFDKDSPILYSDPPLSGVLSRFFSHGCITFGNLKVLLTLSNFYSDEKPGLFDLPYLAASGETVNFEATLINRKEEMYSEFSHEATCAWVGKRPTMTTIASHLPLAKFELLEETDQVFYGKVVKICFPSIALADIPGESIVSVHVGNFSTGPQYPSKGAYRNVISCYVKIDDWIQFKVKRIASLPKLLTASDARPAEFTAETLAKIKSGITVSRAPRESSSKSYPPKRAPTKAPSSSPEPAVCIAAAFKNGCLMQNRAYLIDCSGSVKTGPDHSTVIVNHAFGSSQLSSTTVYVSDGKVMDSKSIKNGRSVRFDAQIAISSNSNFEIKRIWDAGSNVRPPSEVLLFSELSLFEGITTRCCPAKIISIPLHDAAIASVRGVPILVPFDSLLTLQEVNRACSCIDTLLKVGEFVGVEFEKRKFTGQMSGSYFRAVRCWALSKGGSKVMLDDEIRIAAPRINSWFSLWGHGIFFCRSAVKCVDQKYLVNVPVKHRSIPLSLDLFEKNKVCVDGELVDSDKCKLKNGTSICYHVGHDYVEETAGENVEPNFFVACAWIGTEPSPEVCMRDILAVPIGCVASNRHYEVVVQSFPTPYHALCLLGYASVLVPLAKVDENGAFLSVEDTRLKRGDRIVVNVLEKDVQGVTVLVSNTTKIKKVKDCVYHDVLKNISGKIMVLPNPTGLIKPNNCSFMVSFELCNLRRLNKSPGSDKAWLENVRSKINYGKRVYFSAIKVDLKSAPYRAYEVFFD